MEDVSHEILAGKKGIIFVLPCKNKGKFRWKNRMNSTEYGEGFATASTPFTHTSYLEWQIGYDAVVNDEDKTTLLSNMQFLGANGKSKNPYELSEILYLLLQNGFFGKKDIEKLVNKINHSEYSFEEEYSISTTKAVPISITGFDFKRIDITLPTFSYQYGEKKPSIEISIQKQQYATGVQPMVYLTIPIHAFNNASLINGKTSKEIPNGCKWIIDDENKQLILDLFYIFSLCSSRHKHDVNEILKLVVE